MKYKLEKQPIYSDNLTNEDALKFEKHNGAQAIKKKLHLSFFPSSEEEAVELMTREQKKYLVSYVSNIKEKYESGFSILLEGKNYEQREAFLAMFGKYIYMVCTTFEYHNASELIKLEKASATKEDAALELSLILERQFLFIEVTDTTFISKWDFEAFRLILRRRMDNDMPVILIMDDYDTIEWPESLSNYLMFHIHRKGNALKFD